MARWLDLLPESHAQRVLLTDGGLDEQAAAQLLSRRPLAGPDALDPAVVARLID